MARGELTAFGLEYGRNEGIDLIVGAGALDVLPHFLVEGRARPPHVAILAGRGSMRASGVLGNLERRLREVALVATLEGIPSNPSPEDTDRAVDFLVAQQPDTVVALGGGSVIDVAKVANCAAGDGVGAEEVLSRGRVGQRLARHFLAVPTTAGTGSEVTTFATIWDHRQKRKLSLDSPCNRATAALIDPTLTVSLPPAVTRQGAADALAHALESLWSRQRTVISEVYALAAVDLIVPALPDVLAAPTAMESRAAVQRGALLAGLAIAISHTAAAHALSYGLTLYHDVPHGFAVAELLPWICEINLPALPHRVVRHLESVFGGGQEPMPSVLHMYLRQHGLALGLRRYGVTEKDIADLLPAAQVPERLYNNLVPISSETVRHVFERVIRDD